VDLLLGVVIVDPQQRLLQSRHLVADPTMKRGMINLLTPLAHHFFDLPVAARIGRIPEHAP
jgi:hypothetical protein